jgi:hypothetical protein
MLIAKIIASTTHSSWVANLGVVRKKNCEIGLCEDFRNLNQLSFKDNYPLLNMEQLLQRVTGVGMLFMLDGFSRYNHVLVKKEDHHKTALTTPWGAFEYLRMPFRLLNAGSTFQRAMDFANTPRPNPIVNVNANVLKLVSCLISFLYAPSMV